MPSPRTAWGARAGCVWLAAPLAALLLLLQGARSQMHTTVETMDDDCDAQLQWLWGNYTAPPVSPVAGCNSTCLAACYSTLNWAIYSEKKQDCPLQVDIIRCMHVYRAQWTKFVNQCALFEYGSSTSAEAGESGSSSSSSAEGSSAATAEGSSAATAEGSAAAEGAATEGSSATASSSSAEAAAAEGAASTTSTSSSVAEAEAGRRRVLLQEAEASLSSNGSTNVYNGCFPNFANASQYEEYINGEYVFATSSPAAGITLSVFYYVGLLLVGTGLPMFVKAPLAKAKAKMFGSCCGRRNQPTRLDPPLLAQGRGQADDGAEPVPASDAAEPAGLPPVAEPAPVSTS